MRVDLRKVFIGACLIASQPIASAAAAADLAQLSEPNASVSRRGSFVGARLRIPLSNADPRGGRLGLTVAPTTLTLRDHRLGGGAVGEGLGA
jgi:hypothetical protein